MAAGGTTLTGPSQTLPGLYSLPASDFNDVTTGSNDIFRAHVGYDEVTGLGTPKANLLVPALAGYGMSTPTQLAVTNQPPSSVTAGSAFGLTINVESGTGIIDSSYSGNVTLAIATNPGAPRIGGTLTVMAQNGTAVFTGLTLTQAGTGYTIQATSYGLNAAMTSSIAVITASQGTRLAVTIQPPSIVKAGTAFGLTIAVKNRNGTVNTSFNGSVTIALWQPTPTPATALGRHSHGHGKEWRGEIHGPDNRQRQQSATRSGHIRRLDRRDHQCPDRHSFRTFAARDHRAACRRRLPRRPVRPVDRDRGSFRK